MDEVGYQSYLVPVAPYLLLLGRSRRECAKGDGEGRREEERGWGRR